MWLSIEGRLARAIALTTGILLAAAAATATGGSMTVQWDPNTLDGDLSGYRVYVSTDRSIFSRTPAAARPLATTRTVGTSSLAETFTSLDPASTYFAAVTSLDTSGNESIFSNVASGRPGVAPVVTTLSLTWPRSPSE